MHPFLLAAKMIATGGEDPGPQWETRSFVDALVDRWIGLKLTERELGENEALRAMAMVAQELILDSLSLDVPVKSE